MGSGSRGVEHHRKGGVTLQHSTERGEINSDKLQIEEREGEKGGGGGGGGGTHRGQPTDTCITKHTWAPPRW